MELISAFQDRLGRGLRPGAETARASAILDDVVSLAESEARTTWADEEAMPRDARTVVLTAARRVFDNPNMYVVRQAGSFTARVHESAFATGTFTKAELAVLARLRQRSGLYTLATTRGEDACLTGFLPVEGSSEPMPYYAEADPFNAYGDHYGGT